MRLRAYISLAVLLLAALLLSIGLGSVYIPPGEVLRMLLSLLPGVSLAANWTESAAAIVYQIRLPHTVLIALAGAALASSGAVYQGVFRNPLADPYLIGVASGAGLGAVIGLATDRAGEWTGLYTVPAAAFIGAAATIAVVYNLARVGRTVPTTTLILAGVAVSAFATALSSFLMLRSNEELRRAFSWLLGGAIMGGWPPVLAMLPYVTVGMIVLSLSGHMLNVMQFGEEQAQQLGLRVERTKLLLVLAASLTTAAAVAFAGIIGFIGLIVPHLVRFTWGGDYRHLVPLSILAGSTALLLADILARVAIAPQVIPVGIVTALAGAPFFLWILRRAKDQAYW
jgi:iron complex transport system permease protein